VPERDEQLSNDASKWASLVLFLAAAYNLVWGTLACSIPTRMLAWYGIDAPDRPELWQCIGMLVGLYGIAYWFASRNPHALWPIVLVGLLGKILGPVGTAVGIAQGRLPWDFAWANVTNDLVWLAPFAWVLKVVRSTPDPSTPSRGLGTLTLYERVLGRNYALLSPKLRHFHAAHEPIEVRGTFEVIRGRSRLGNWLTDLSGFPRERRELPVSLTVRPDPPGERWIRVFGDRVIESWQGQMLGLFAQRFGSLVMYLEAEVRDGALIVRDLRSTFLGIPLPPALSPQVHAHGRDRDDAISVRIRITNRIVGLLIEYSGSIAIQPASSQPSRSGFTSAEANTNRH